MQTFSFQNSLLAASPLLPSSGTRLMCTDSWGWGGVSSSCSFLTSSACHTSAITPKRSLFEYICYVNYLVISDFMTDFFWKREMEISLTCCNIICHPETSYAMWSDVDERLVRRRWWFSCQLTDSCSAARRASLQGSPVRAPGHSQPGDIKDRKPSRRRPQPLVVSRDHASSCWVGNDFRSHSPFKFASGGHQILILKVWFCQLKIKSIWHFTGNVDSIWKELSQELWRGNTHCSCMMHTPVSQLCPSDWHLKGSHSVSDEFSFLLISLWFPRWAC